VRVELQLANESLDIISGEIDVALRVGALADSNLGRAAPRGVQHADLREPALPRAARRAPAPGRPAAPPHARDDLKSRRNGGFVWPLSDGMDLRDFTVDPVLVANDPAALRGALLCGEGLMLAADVTMRAFVELGHIRRVLSAWNGPEVDFNAVFPRGQVPSPKIRAFVDFLVGAAQLRRRLHGGDLPDKQRYEKLAQEASKAVAADLMRSAKPANRVEAREVVETRG
jgi:DNA-binding transcriptional LysR family regulator